MTTIHFQNLLEDLYDLYNPEKKQDVQHILNKYNGQEADAIYQLLFKYNYSKHPLYNPKINNIKFIKILIDGYSEEKRLLKNKDFLQQHFDKILENDESTNKRILEDFKKEISNDNQKQLEEIKKQHEEELQRLAENIKNKKTIEDEVEIKLNLLWSDREILIPSAIKNASLNDRVITKDSEGNIVGLEIKDIYWDCISDEKKIFKEITIGIA